MKKILILIIPFLVTGCATVDYNLKIEKDLSVVESANISATKEYFNNFYKHLPITIVKGSYENDELMSPIKANNYLYELKKDNTPFPSVFVSKTFNNIEDYSKNTIFKGQSFNEINVSSNDNLVTIKTEGFNKYKPEDSGEDNNRFPVSNLAISIKLPYVVTNSNADKVNRRDNIYTWIINEKTTEKEINITFDKTKIYIYNIIMYISLVIIAIIAIVMLIIFLKIRKRNKENNRI